MLSKTRITFVNSLKIKKYRELHQQFTAEGSKLVLDLLKSSIKVIEIFANREWIAEQDPELPGKIPVTEVREEEMGRITSLATPSPVMVLLEIPKEKTIYPEIGKKLILVLDDIRDPGNMGTILRIADWFGIETVVCSETSVDIYNPKVVQASMGSIARVKVCYSELKDFFARVPDDVPVYGAFLSGENIYRKELDDKGILVVGSEADGISADIEKCITDRLFIPSFSYPGDTTGKAESLNASVATAIVCSEFRRKRNSMTSP